MSDTAAMCTIVGFTITLVALASWLGRALSLFRSV